MKTVTFYLLVLFALSVALISSCSSNEHPESIATIGSYQVDEVSYKHAFSEFYYRTGRSIPINSFSKKQVLESEINKLALVQYAYDKGIANREHLQFEKKRIAQKALINRVIHRMFLDTMQVYEPEVRQLFYDFNTYVRVSHLFAENLGEALSLKDRLQKGESFDDLAKETFKNNYLANNGGDLGFFTVDEMDIMLEKAAFRAPKGEIQGPVKTSNGYSVFKVTEREVRPLITETEFLNQKQRFESFARNQKETYFLRSYAEQFAKEVKLEESYQQKLIDAFENGLIERVSSNEWAFPLPENTSLPKYNGEEIERVSIEMASSFLSANEKSLIKTKEQFFDFIDGVLFRAYHIQKRNVLSDADQKYIRESVEQSWKNRLQSEVRDQILVDLEIPNDSLIAFFNREPSLFNSPLKLDLLRLRVRSETQANEALAFLKRGGDFKQALKKYSLSTEDLMVEGKMGWVDVQNLGTLATHFRQLQAGEYTEVLQYQSGEWHIYKCIAREESKPQSFTEAKDQVEGALLSIWHKKAVAKVISQTREKHHVQIDSEILSNINLSHLK